MITVKEYADRRNKSVQAVYKQLRREKNKRRLEGHLIKQNRMTYLDEEAIKILDEGQNVSIILVDQETKNEEKDELSEYKDRVANLIETNNQLRDQQDLLKNKIINLQDELKVKTEQMTSLLLENKEKTLLLEQKKDQTEEIYKLNTFNEIKQYCEQNNKQIYDYVYETEGEEIKNFLGEIWEAMKESICLGLNAEGIIPGKLQLSKRAKSIYNNKIENEPTEVKRTRLLTAYAYAVSETNASGGEIVTAPTCGSCGVLPASLYYLQKEDKYTDEEIINALATAGIIGNIVKTNASISGAECGCQAEIGTACSMAAAACSQLRKLDIYKIEHAAEIAMEHHLGLTCDPIYGYVQIPCIERNAVAAIRAIDASNISMLLDENQKISFDLITETMYETGKDLRSHYRETSTGGLAKKYCRNKYYNTDME